MIFSLLAHLALLQLIIPRLCNHGLFFDLAILMLLRAISLLFYLPGIKAAIRETCAWAK